MNFNISLNDRLSKKIIKEADEKNVTPTHYIEILLDSIIVEDSQSFDYLHAAKNVIDQAETLANLKPLGFTFALNDLPYFQEINNAVILDGKAVPSTIKARIGRNFNKSVANKKVKNIKRAFTKDNELKFLNGSAVYVVATDEENQ